MQLVVVREPRRPSVESWLLHYALGEAGTIHLTGAQIAKAVERGFAPWLARALENHGQSVTAEHEGVLRLAARGAALQARNLQQWLAYIVQRAAERDISVCLLKGVALEPWLYPGAGFRPMADVDVLIEPALQHRFEQLLTALGHVQRSSFPGPWPVDHHHSMPFWHPEQGTWIEVHTRLAPAVANVLLAEQETFDYHGTVAKRLRAPAQTLYTVAHWAKCLPGSKGLVALLDLALLLRHTGLPDLDCYDFDKPQRAWMRRALGVACSLLSNSTISANLTPPARLEGWRRRRLSRLAKRYIIDDKPHGQRRSPRFPDVCWRALMYIPDNTVALLREPRWSLFPLRKKGSL